MHSDAIVVPTVNETDPSAGDFFYFKKVWKQPKTAQMSICDVNVAEMDYVGGIVTSHLM